MGSGKLRAYDLRAVFAAFLLTWPESAMCTNLLFDKDLAVAEAEAPELYRSRKVIPQDVRSTLR
ncbi:MAG: hypothetical protein C0428_01195 [Polaromonas sp.]|nr:hypothetical protein [Polaromonas sp.]